MRKVVLAIVMLSLSFSVMSVKAYANDSTVFDNGYSVSPINTDKIRMVKEKIHAKINDPENIYVLGSVLSSEAYVICEFVFENITDKEITATIGFPTSETDNYMSNRNIELYDFISFVDGKKVNVKRKKEIIRESELDTLKVQTYRYWYTWEVKFPPNERIVLKNEYRTYFSYSSIMDQWFEYILITGANWSGPIGKVNVVVEYETEDMLRERVTKATPEGYVIEGNKLVWRFKDHIPKENIKVYEKHWPKNLKLPSSIARLAYLALKWNDYDGSMRLYDISDITFGKNKNRIISAAGSWYSNFQEIIEYEDYKVLLQKSYVKALRNEVFARHGRNFVSEELQYIFGSTDWYKPDTNYSDDMLNDIERKNVNFILDYEKKMGWK